jgi:hypothetical protein
MARSPLHPGEVNIGWTCRLAMNLKRLRLTSGKNSRR